MENSGIRQYLLEAEGNGWAFPEGTDYHQLALALIECLASADDQLRDELAYSALETIIREKRLPACHPALLEVCTDDRHLFLGIGSSGDDSVFMRAFSALTIGALADAGGLSEEQLCRAYKCVVRYLEEEKDLRGFVEGKGWAHSCAHTADAIKSLVRAGQPRREEISGLLDAIGRKMCLHEYTYINGEDERMVSAVMALIDCAAPEEAQLCRWVRGLGAVTPPEYEPHRDSVRANRKCFLRSLYFRLKGSRHRALLGAVEETLSAL